MAKAFRFYYSVPDTDEDDYLVDHGIFSYLLDREGKVLEIYGKYVTDLELASRLVVDIERDLQNKNN